MSSEMLKPLVGRKVRIEREGPGAREGKLLAVGEDFAVLHHEKEGIIYFAIGHLKNVMIDTKDTSDLLPPPPPPVNGELPLQPVLPVYVDKGFMTDALNSMMLRWVQVNRHGHESVQGVLNDVQNDYFDVINQNQLIRISREHLKSISFLVMDQQNSNQNSNQEKNKNSKNKKNKK